MTETNLNPEDQEVQLPSEAEDKILQILCYNFDELKAEVDEMSRDVGWKKSVLWHLGKAAVDHREELIEMAVGKNRK